MIFCNLVRASCAGKPRECGRVGRGVKQPIPRDHRDTQQGGPDSHAKEPDDCKIDAQGAAAPGVASQPVCASHLISDMLRVGLVEL